MEPKIGQKLWTIAPSDESVRAGEGGFKRPWLGIITKLYPYGDFLICHFDENDKPDDDSNASAMVPLSLLYETEEEAWTRYKQWVEDRLCGYQKESVYVNDRMAKGFRTDLTNGS